jgi:hypothetical protein
MLLNPKEYNIATAKVISAIAVSAALTKYFRLYLSAQTPAKGETNTMGSIAAAVKSAINDPDCSCKVICQVTACETSIEPNIDTNWPAIKKLAFLFQFNLFPLLSMIAPPLKYNILE